MTVIKSKYADILRHKKIVYMPSCLVVEMMIKLYYQVSAISVSDNINSVVPDILVLLRRLNLNLICTAEAFEQSRIHFFIGEWREDKLRARKLFFNLMSRLGFISEPAGMVERKLLYEAIEEMGRNWSALDKIMEKRCDDGKFHKHCGTCRYFRSVLPESWCQVMAGIILSLANDQEDEDPDTHLILLCYSHIKQLLLREIGEIEARTRPDKKFDADRILCASDEEVSLTCPGCETMMESVAHSRTAPMLRAKKTANLPVRPISLKYRPKPAVEALPRSHAPSGFAAVMFGKT